MGRTWTQKRFMRGLVGKLDDAFVDVAVAKRLLAERLGDRVLAFAAAKKKPVAEVAVDLGLIAEKQAARVAKLARYRVARAEDRIYSEVAARLGILLRGEARDALVRQRELYEAGRGFIRLSALLRSERRISRDEDHRIQRAMRAVERPAVNASGSRAA